MKSACHLLTTCHSSAEDGWWKKKGGPKRARPKRQITEVDLESNLRHDLQGAREAARAGNLAEVRLTEH